MLLRNSVGNRIFFYRNTVKYFNFNSLQQELIDRRPDLNLERLVDDKNTNDLEKNISKRKGVGNVKKIKDIWKEIQNFEKTSFESIDESRKVYKNLWDQLYWEAYNIPNDTHPETPIGEEDKGEVIKCYGETNENLPDMKIAEDIIKKWGVLSYPNKYCGNRSYYFNGYLSGLEKALLNYVYNYVKNLGFTPVIVPDIVDNNTTVSCGVFQRSEHPIQYDVLGNPFLHLSGTSEMGLAGMVEGKIFLKHDVFPKKFVSLSRCYRPEISKSTTEAKLYRVHEFFKVEMFSICKPDQSDKVLEEFVDIQTKILEDLDIPYQLINMSSEELGAAAYKKYDINGLMPGRKIYGEVTSASNCTDYQARRLNLRYKNENGDIEYLHTVNGTAIASTRALICLIENMIMRKEKPKFIEKLNMKEERDFWKPIKMSDASSFKY
uniref:serine--tRNA ligase n=1 Tax=Parastrongyloides trichosuri TaxID=131310 RepID=A0A0N4Z771_PARTI